MCKGCETGLTVCRPYPRRLESPTVCGSLYLSYIWIVGETGYERSNI